MNQPTVYIETSVPSYAVSKPSENLFRAARQISTIKWWETCKDQFKVFSSAFTLDEAGKGDKIAAAKRLSLLQSIQLLQIEFAWRS